MTLNASMSSRGNTARLMGMPTRPPSTRAAGAPVKTPAHGGRRHQLAGERAAHRQQRGQAGPSAQAQNDMATMPKPKPDRPCTNPAATGAQGHDQQHGIHKSALHLRDSTGSRSIATAWRTPTGSAVLSLAAQASARPAAIVCVGGGAPRWCEPMGLHTMRVPPAWPAEKAGMSVWIGRAMEGRALTSAQQHRRGTQEPLRLVFKPKSADALVEYAPPAIKWHFNPLHRGLFLKERLAPLRR